MAAGKAKGYGNLSTARNVFKLAFSYALSSAVKYYAYDNDQTFPTLDTVVTVLNDILAGTAGNSSKSMVGLVDTTNAAPSSDWFPASATGGSANPNRLKGTTSFVTQAGAVRGAGEAITYNMAIEVPSDVTTAMALGFDLAFVYTYTGTPPVLTHSYNNAAAGTEGTPDWDVMVPGTDGMIHCRAGSGPTGDGGDNHFFMTVPLTGVALTEECWINTDLTP